jgi:hypothetical protein
VVGSGGTNTTTNLTLGATSISLANTNLTLNLNAGTGSGYAGATTGQGNELVVGNSPVNFGSGVQLTLNVQNETSVVPGYSAFVLIAGSSTTTISGSSSTGQYTGLTFGGLAPVQPVNGTATLITTGSNLQLLFGNAGDAAAYANGSYLVLYQYNNGSTTFDDIDIVVVPEPGTWALMLGGLAALLFIQRRKRRDP